MTLKRCTVIIHDLNQTEHALDVTTEMLYEAVAQALAALGANDYSQDEVPIERGFILELRKWQTLCLDSEGHWLFPSPVTGRPYHADSIRTDYLAPYRSPLNSETIP
ncbi:MAG: hypothetical protein WB660_25950 [Candidatus Sulfotelmatobacter sp.]